MGPSIPALVRIWCRHAIGASLSIWHERLYRKWMCGRREATGEQLLIAQRTRVAAAASKSSVTYCNSTRE
jgi:hypothetical protein